MDRPLSPAYPPPNTSDTEKALHDAVVINYLSPRIVKLERVIYASLVVATLAFIAAMVNLGFMSAFMTVSFSVFMVITNTILLFKSKRQRQHRELKDSNIAVGEMPTLAKKTPIGFMLFNAILWPLNTSLTGWIIYASRSPDFGEGPWRSLRLVPGIIEAVLSAILAAILWTLAVMCIRERRRLLIGMVPAHTQATPRAKSSIFPWWGSKSYNFGPK